MRATLALLMIISTLAACSDPVKDAERELQIVIDTKGSLQDQCQARRKVAQAYLKAQDPQGYFEANVHAEGTCLDVQLEQQYGRR